MELLFGSLRDTYKGPRNFVNCKGAQNTFSKISNTGKVSQTPHMGQEQPALIHEVALNHSYTKPSLNCLW